MAQAPQEADALIKVVAAQLSAADGHVSGTAIKLMSKLMSCEGAVADAFSQPVAVQVCVLKGVPMRRGLHTCTCAAQGHLHQRGLL